MKINIEGTDGDAITYTINEAPKYVPVQIDEDLRVVFVEFTPTNGYNKGRIHSVPFARVIEVVE